MEVIDLYFIRSNITFILICKLTDVKRYIPKALGTDIVRTFLHRTHTLKCYQINKESDNSEVQVHESMLVYYYGVVYKFTFINRDFTFGIIADFILQVASGRLSPDLSKISAEPDFTMIPI